MSGLGILFEMTSRDYTFWGPELFNSSFLAHFFISSCPYFPIHFNRFKYNIVPEIFQKPKASCVKCHYFYFIVHITLQATVAEAMLERKIFLKRYMRDTKQQKMSFLFVFNCELPSEYPHDPTSALLLMLQEEVHFLVYPFWNYSLDELFQTDLVLDDWIPL